MPGLNPHKIEGTIDAISETVGPYRYRTGTHGPVTLRAELLATGWTGTITLNTCAPDAAASTGYVSDTYTAAESVVIEPGADADLYFVCTAYTAGSMVCRLYKGPSNS